MSFWCRRCMEQSLSPRCTTRPCLHCCPAHLYTLDPDSGKVLFEHAGCLECGTCLAVCPEDLDWNHPEGSFGVQYRYG